MESTKPDAATPPRAWRWGVWHEGDRSWLAALAERNTRLMPLLLLDADRPIEASIPRITHQIWLGPRAIPANCREWMQSWTTLHPTWKYVRIRNGSVLSMLSLKLTVFHVLVFVHLAPLEGRRRQDIRSTQPGPSCLLNCDSCYKQLLLKSVCICHAMQ